MDVRLAVGPVTQRTQLTAVGRDDQGGGQTSGPAGGDVPGVVADHPRPGRIAVEAVQEPVEEAGTGLAARAGPDQGRIAAGAAVRMVEADLDRGHRHALACEFF